MTPKRTEGRRARRAGAFAASLVVSGIAVLGAYAGANVLDLGMGKPHPVTDEAIAARERKLETYAESLRRSRAKTPPPLPAVPAYPTVSIPVVPDLSQAVSRTPASAEPTEIAEEDPGSAPVTIKYVRSAPVERVERPGVEQQHERAEHDEHEEEHPKEEEHEQEHEEEHQEEHHEEPEP